MVKQGRKNAFRDSSIYPQPYASGSEVIVRISGGDLSAWDKVLVTLSSLCVVGSVAWVPLLFRWLWRKWKKTKDASRRAFYAALIIAFLGIKIVGPHRNPRVGAWLKVREWSLWKSWLRYTAFEVIADSPTAKRNFIREKQAILAVSPHGLFPFGLAFAALPEEAAQAFGYFRPVVATATNFFPFVNTFLKWLISV